MRTESLVERLSRDLRPIRPRKILREAAILIALGLVELAAFFAMGFMRPDMPTAMAAPSFWWKLASTGLIAVLGAGVAIVSNDPVRSPRPGLRWMLACIALIFASGWLIDAAHNGLSGLLLRLNWTQGIQCVWEMVVLSVPLAIGLGVLIRRGASTDRAGTALAAGLASAAWGAFVFVFACPSDDPLYIAVWYTIGCGIVTVLGQVALLRVSRW
ncbi:DUF1109 domain-containing protein [Acidisoma cladoniae]|jgi:hypothetical protein|uniref:DUF1109 domain-containing protein n=1 Tax=Acidisoma cladoniae TaxID=3040935 RepID=UPI002550CBFA|nr:DUF1109 domain-containing protein [Acidisoma sp. PAMC 29798]